VSDEKAHIQPVKVAYQKQFKPKSPRKVRSKSQENLVKLANFKRAKSARADRCSGKLEAARNVL
jgi:hypothetical protein